jgi:hypothetical protein
MSAELSGTIYVGPTRDFSKAVVAKAAKQAQRCLDSLNDTDKQKTKTTKKNCPLNLQADGDLQELIDDDANLLDVMDLRNIEGQTFTGEVVSQWREPSDDASFRDIKIGDRTARIVAAGGTSDGDQPDGFAFRLLRMADLMGVLDILGIK